MNAPSQPSSDDPGAILLHSLPLDQWPSLRSSTKTAFQFVPVWRERGRPAFPFTSAIAASQAGNGTLREARSVLPVTGKSSWQPPQWKRGAPNGRRQPEDFKPPQCGQTGGPFVSGRRRLRNIVLASASEMPAPVRRTAGDRAVADLTRRSLNQGPTIYISFRSIDGGMDFETMSPSISMFQTCAMSC